MYRRMEHSHVKVRISLILSIIPTVDSVFMEIFCQNNRLICKSAIIHEMNEKKKKKEKISIKFAAEHRQVQ